MVETVTVADDFVSSLLAKLKKLLPSATDDQLTLIEDEIRTEWGGEEPYIAKTDKRRKDKAVNQYIGGTPIKEIRKKTGISRATLYRHLKKGD
jgi:transcriptional regulator of acetoin/glycerol metabolism